MDDDRTAQEEYHHQMWEWYYHVTQPPEPVPDRTEEEMNELEERAIDAEVKRRQAMWGKMVYVSRDVVRLERQLAA